ncbi:cation diffusion facilitator family transporter [Anaerococcus octavius]|uniref:cation diffusion facilitator family transporter n=1 Tax=Anaerococcus octavius TaxID=54007 RepID=UPI0027B97079|nr:cation transporter [Anaerococcus octavius]
MRKLQDLKKQDENAAEREKQIVKTSVVGIIANVVLAAIKAIVGLASNSIAIILDAVNNISDAGSSLITIVGTKLAAKDPDKEHPFGYGRVEYLSAMIISVIDIFSRGNKKDYESSYTYIYYTIFNYSNSSSCG